MKAVYVYNPVSCMDFSDDVLAVGNGMYDICCACFISKVFVKLS